MGWTKRCPACNLQQAERKLGEFGKKFTGPVLEDVEELSDVEATALQKEDASSNDLSIQAT